MLGIPKVLGQIWIGCRQAPTEWMQTWSEKHPDWKYIVYDNEYLMSRRWRNQKLIEEYFKRKEYAGVSDLMRYEILFDEGGFIPPSDAICLKNTDELFEVSTLYSVYENEERRPGFISPFLASVPDHEFLKTIIDDIHSRYTPDTLSHAWKSVGNKYLADMLNEHEPEITIFPSHFFIPHHKASGHKRGKFPPRYDGPGPVYAEEFWGSTQNIYKPNRPWKQRHIRDKVLSALADNRPV